MIANARMYSISPQATALWRELLSAIIATADLPVEVIDHPAPASLDELWSRRDQAAVFMCGLPFSRAVPPPTLIAAPVPAPAAYGDTACYWSDWVVARESDFQRVADTFGQRIALTTPGSQSGYAAPLQFLQALEAEPPLYRELVAPTVTPRGALSAVVDGVADIAPIDSYAFALLQRFSPELTSRVRVIGSTLPTPIPPLVASRAGLDSLQQAFLNAHRREPLAALMEKLLLRRFARPDATAYAPLRERYAASMSYWSSHPLAASTAPAFAW